MTLRRGSVGLIGVVVVCRHGVRAGLVGVLVAGLLMAPAASASAAVKPSGAAVPSTPVLASVSSVGVGALVTWLPNPTADAVTSYRVTAAPVSGSKTAACPGPAKVSATVASSATSATVRTLCAGVVYQATVHAVNAAGTSGASALSSPVVPLTVQVPTAPLLTTVTPRNGSLVLTWTAPVDSGGATVSGYTETASARGAATVTATVAGTATTATLTGLTNRTTYTVSVSAANTAGKSPAATGKGTPSTVYAPTAPQGLTVAPDGSGHLVTSWAAPADNGGSAITGYTLIYQQAAQSASGSWAVISTAPVHTIATSGTVTTATASVFEKATAFYLFSVTATNTAGTGSSASSPTALTPTATIASGTVVLSASAAAALTSVTATTLVWTDPAPASVSALTAGQTVVAAAGGLLPEGTLRTVNSVSNAAGRFTVTTRQASLSSVLSTATVDVTTNPAGAVAVSSVIRTAGGSGARFVPSAAGVALAPASTAASAGWSQSLVFSVNHNVGPVKLSAQVAITGALNLSLDLTHGPVGVANGVSVTSSASVSTSVSATATLSGSWDTRLGELVGSPIDVQVGEVPLVIVPRIPVFLHADGSISLSEQVSATVGASLSWSSKAASRLAVKNMSTAPHGLGGRFLPGLTATGTADLSLTVQPQADIYGVGGPDVQAVFSLNAAANLAPKPGQPYLSITPSITPSAELALNLFSSATSLSTTLAATNWSPWTLTAAPSPYYTITGASAVSPGKSVQLHATRSSGTGTPTWSLVGAAPGDTISSSGLLTAAKPAGRTLTVRATDAGCASGRITLSVGAAFNPPASLSAVAGPTGTTASLSWTAPTSLAGSTLASYRITTSPATTTVSAAAGAKTATLTGLTAGATYTLTLYAVASNGQLSPPATVLLTEPTATQPTPTQPVATEAPLPPGAATNPAATLESVACSGSSKCTAVGYYTASDGTQRGLIETLSGGVWTAAQPPVPAGAATVPAVTLASVACSGSSTCTAVGYYTASDGTQRGLIETLSGGVWTATQAPVPAGADTNPAMTLGSVACGGSGSCTAVGQYDSSNGYQQGLIETLSGGLWTATQAPAPANADTIPAVTLGSVACGGSGSCTAIGSYLVNNRYLQGLVETLSGGVWTATQAPLPANAVTNMNAELGSVACGGPSSCTAIGQYYSSNGYRGLIETLSGGVWTATQAPLPANDPATDTPDLVSVACGGPGSCTVVGSYDNNSQGLIETLSGGVWTATQAPLPVNADTNMNAELQSVACGSTGSCTATGYYFASNGILQGLVETLSGGVWTATQAPLPANADTSQGAALGSVACGGPGSCSAIGYYYDSNGQQGLIERLG